jgi:hypothetical protein
MTCQEFLAAAKGIATSSRETRADVARHLHTCPTCELGVARAVLRRLATGVPFDPKLVAEVDAIVTEDEKDPAFRAKVFPQENN